MEGNVLARYTQTQSVDEPLAMLRSGTTSFYHADGLGSITSITASTGVLAAMYSYDSFGNLASSTGTLTNPFRYTAREFDSETNLYFYRARYYDPAAGRFLSEDTHREIIRGMNFYEYVRNAPPNLLDPDGRGALDWIKKILDGLKHGHEIKEKIETPIDWALCGVFYVTCLETGLGIKADLAQALNSADPNVYATAKATLAQQLGANSDSMLNLKACMLHDENCQKALKCAEKGLTNPLPVPSNWVTDLIETVRHFFGGNE